MVKCKYKHLFMTPRADNVAANACRSQGWSDGRKKKKHSSFYTRDMCNLSVPVIFLFPLSSWFYVLPENVAFWAMKRETFLWESCCLKLPSENTFRSTPKEPATELCSCSWPQFLCDTMLNCSPPQVAKRYERKGKYCFFLLVAVICYVKVIAFEMVIFSLITLR